MEVHVENISYLMLEREKEDILAQIFGAEEVKKRPASVTIGKTPEEIFAFVRNFKNFSKFWKRNKDWNIQIVSFTTNKVLVCEVIEDKPTKSIFAFLFEPDVAGKGTVVSLKIVYENAAARVADIAQKLVGEDLHTLANVNLRRLKAYLETGEVPTTEGQPNGKEEIEVATYHH